MASDSSDIGVTAPPYFAAFGLSATSRLLSAAITNPLDRCKVLLQTRPGTNPNLPEVIFRGYRGIVPRMAGTFVYSSVHLGFLASIRTDPLSFSSMFMAHGLAKVVATTLAYPFDTRYTLRACGITPPAISQMRPHFPGFGLALLAAPLSVGCSLLTVSFLGMIFPLTQVSTDYDFVRGVGVGTAGALGGALCVYPIDTVRRRVMTGEFTLKQAIGAGRYFRGLPVFVLKAVPESILLTYSYLCNLRYFTFLS
jgi:hypothetical protein